MGLRYDADRVLPPLLVLVPPMSAATMAQAALLIATCADETELALVHDELMHRIFPANAGVLEVVSIVRDAVTTVRGRTGGQEPVTAAAAARCARILDEYQVRWNDATEGLSLYHDPCGTLICDVEHDDSLGVLAATGLAHRCPRPTTKEN